MGISLGARTVIVTGAARDVGRVLAQRFLDAGARVMMADRDEGALAAAETMLAGDTGRLARFSYTAGDRISVANLIAATVERFERVDVLVNAAEPASETGPPAPTGAPDGFLDLDPERFDAAFIETVRAVFQLSQAAARCMIRRHEESGRDPAGTAGAIVNVSSIAGRRLAPGHPCVAVPHAALDQLTRSMAVSLAPHGVRVNGVALGGVVTDRLRAAFEENTTLCEEMVRATPLGRLGDIEEAAEVALFVASDHASYLTGQIIAVDGGRTLLDPLAPPAG